MHFFTNKQCKCVNNLRTFICRRRRRRHQRLCRDDVTTGRRLLPAAAARMARVRLTRVYGVVYASDDDRLSVNLPGGTKQHSYPRNFVAHLVQTATVR